MKKISAFLKNLSKIPWLIAGNVFVSGLAVFFIAFIFSGIVFYEYIILSKENKDLVPKSSFQIDEGNYQKFLDFRQQQEGIFNNAVCQNCRDIFKSASAR